MSIIASLFGKKIRQWQFLNLLWISKWSEWSRENAVYHHVVLNHVPGTGTKHQHWSLRYVWNICEHMDGGWMLWYMSVYCDSCSCPCTVMQLHQRQFHFRINHLPGNWLWTALQTLWMPLIWLWYVGQFPSSKSTCPNQREDFSL